MHARAGISSAVRLWASLALGLSAWGCIGGGGSSSGGDGRADAGPAAEIDEAACCAARLICDTCRCSADERRAIADHAPAACQAMLDARPESCALPPNPNGVDSLSIGSALAFCDQEAVEDFGEVTFDCAGCAESVCAEGRDGGVCSQRCELFGPGCPAGSLCYGICIAPGPAVFGEDCVDDSDCRSLTCHSDARACSWICDEAEDCPADHVCDGGVCRGGAAPGELCNRDFDCALARCVDGACESLGALGDRCNAGADCASQICGTFAVGEEGFCTRECDLGDNPCPEGFECLPGNPSLCVPPQ